MATECEHERLNVIWGDSSAYYERTNEITVVNDEYTNTDVGEWVSRDGGHGEDTDQWLIHVNCADCERVYYSENEHVSENLSVWEKSVPAMVREMGSS
jgi:hypothetical protein